MVSDFSEQRKRSRPDVPQEIFVVDVLTLNRLGTVVNLHEDGFMIIGAGNVKESCVYQLEFHLSKPVENVGTVPIGAECLWINETGSGNQYWAGFQIIDIAEDSAKIISKVVEQIHD